MAEISTQKRPLGGFPWVIPVYHWGNQTRENQEADQGPQSMKKPPSPATERFCRPWMPVSQKAAPMERTAYAKQMYYNQQRLSSPHVK